jgi:hypothetical protein
MPDFVCVLSDPSDVAEFAQRRGARVLGSHSALEVLARFHFDMLREIAVKIVEIHCAGLRMRPIAAASVSHLEVSTASCFRPAGVRR